MSELNICENCEVSHTGEYGSGRFCSIKCSRGFSTKAKRKEINEKVSLKMKKDGHIKQCEFCGNDFKTKRKIKRFCNSSCSTKKLHTDVDFREKIKKKLDENGNWGGYQKNSSRGKSGWYKGYWCDSSYELVYVIYNLEHNIKFQRNKEGFEYIFNNKTYKYYPDFILDDGTYIEIKNFLTEQVKEKIKQFKHKLNILFKKDILYMFDYVINKYGKKFIKLYE